MDQPSAIEQERFGLGNLRVRDTAIDRADRRAFFVIEEADAFGALLRRDVINIFGDRRMAHAIEFPPRAANVDRVIGASRQASAAVDAFFGDYGSHREYFSYRP